MYGQRAAGAWCGRLLLFAALLLGIVTMHTLGHPGEHSGAGGGARAGMSGSAYPGMHDGARGEPHAGVRIGAHAGARRTPGRSTLSGRAFTSPSARARTPRPLPPQPSARQRPRTTAGWT
ncbi:hypothetical protein [Streptomyces sp. H27-D2]|uniref:hypothetical protein n=1 Tax=Streptomyces sp. H27-D2 TaxID=3046304 RepID=UPI002DBE2D37|nr:hypothetical protein [Streptomyces sp. H27-D2]MEC4017231.1 hypothetical protein [Streptomyces sp. H27-D2]